MTSNKSQSLISKTVAKTSINAEPSSGPSTTIKPAKSQSIVHNATSRQADSSLTTIVPTELTNVSKLVNTMDMRQNQMSSVSLPSLGGKRRVHQDGILMLDNHIKMQETE